MGTYAVHCAEFALLREEKGGHAARVGDLCSLCLERPSCCGPQGGRPDYGQSDGYNIDGDARVLWGVHTCSWRTSQVPAEYDTALSSLQISDDSDSLVVMVYGLLAA